MIDPHGREEMKRRLSHCLLALALAVSGVVSGITTGTKAQSQRARQGPQTPAPIPGPIVQPSATFPFDEFGSGVALSRNGTLAVGARSEDGGAGGANGGEIDNSVTDSGTVYLFNY